MPLLLNTKCNYIIAKPANKFVISFVWIKHLNNSVCISCLKNAILILLQKYFDYYLTLSVLNIVNLPTKPINVF